jgi:hypothetical protein
MGPARLREPEASGSVVQQRALSLFRAVPLGDIGHGGVGARAAAPHVVDCLPQPAVGVSGAFGHDGDGVLGRAQAGTRTRRIGQHEVVVVHGEIGLWGEAGSPFRLMPISYTTRLGPLGSCPGLPPTR